MRLTSDCWAVLGCVVAALLATAAARMSVGDACRMADHSPGICRLPADCSILREAVKRQVISVNDIPHCGFSGLLEIICCPTDSAVGRPFVESTLIFEERPRVGDALPPPNDDSRNPVALDSPAPSPTPPTVELKTGLEGPEMPIISPFASRNSFRTKAVPVPSTELEPPPIPYRNLSVSRNPFLARASFWLLQNGQGNAGNGRNTSGFGFGDGNKNESRMKAVPNVFGKRYQIGPGPDESKRYGTKNTTEPSLPAPSIVKPAPGGLRRAEIACRNLEEHLEPDLTSQILDGTPVEPGEYPHMAAIGFTGSLNESGPIDFRCGGTLIHKQFVLTAAHCVNIRDGTAKIVRLGVVNLKDKNPVDIPIKESYTHPEFSTLRKVNDIAILELEYPANYSNGIFPTCLYTNAKDPDPSTKLYVTGWGYVNTSTFEASDILLKARLQMVPLDKCKESFQLFGQQLRDSHLCATDPGLTKDACHGDSGGPLNAVLSEDLKQYRVVGIIMSGIGCATIIPGLYTRVASYLDFIEDIVWPADKPERLLY